MTAQKSLPQQLMPAKTESSVDPLAAVADLNEERRIAGQIKSQIELNRSLQYSQKSRKSSAKKSKTPITSQRRRADSIKKKSSTISSKSGKRGSKKVSLAEKQQTASIQRSLSRKSKEPSNAER